MSSPKNLSVIWTVNFVGVSFGLLSVYISSSDFTLSSLSSCLIYECIFCLLHNVFFPSFQSHWLGDKYLLRGSEGNDIHKTNVPNLRISFRYEVKKLRQIIYKCCLICIDSFMITILIFILSCLRFLVFMQTWKEEMQFIYAGQAVFLEDVDP